MRIIEISALDNGAHRNQTGTVPSIPDGWAVIPDTLETPNFPFGEVETGEINGVITVTRWTPLPMPATDPAPDPEEPSQLDRIEAQVTYTAMMTDTLMEV